MEITQSKSDSNTRGEKMLFIIYLILGYWAVGETIFKNKVIISFRFGGAFLYKLIAATFLGWLLIPIAIIKVIFFRG